MGIKQKNIYSGSDVGCVRKANEDSCGYKFNTPYGDLFVVCDGMGGHVGGAVASKIAVESIITDLSVAKYGDPREAIAQAIEYANMQILGTAAEHPELKGMGTTACVLIVKDGLAWIGHVGDSRIYLYHGAEQYLYRITKDHSYVQRLVDMGQITDAQAEHHPNKNRILKALGIQPDCQPEVCPKPIKTSRGDIFLICSDGLSGMLSDENIQTIITADKAMTPVGASQDTPMAQKGADLIELARQAGGNDNITAQLILISESPYAQSEFVSFNPRERRAYAGPQSQVCVMASGNTLDPNEVKAKKKSSSVGKKDNDNGKKRGFLSRRVEIISALAIVVIILGVSAYLLFSKGPDTTSTGTGSKELVGKNPAKSGDSHSAADLQSDKNQNDKQEREKRMDRVLDKDGIKADGGKYIAERVKCDSDFIKKQKGEIEQRARELLEQIDSCVDADDKKQSMGDVKKFFAGEWWKKEYKSDLPKSAKLRDAYEKFQKEKK